MAEEMRQYQESDKKHNLACPPPIPEGPMVRILATDEPEKTAAQLSKEIENLSRQLQVANLKNEELQGLRDGAMMQLKEQERQLMGAQSPGSRLGRLNATFDSLESATGAGGRDAEKEKSGAQGAGNEETGAAEEAEGFDKTADESGATADLSQEAAEAAEIKKIERSRAGLGGKVLRTPPKGLK